LLGGSALGDLDSFGPVPLTPPRAPSVPAWTQPCWIDPGRGRPFVHRCARLSGRVVWTEESDPDGDGDAHRIVMAGLRPVDVKVPGLFP